MPDADPPAVPLHTVAREWLRIGLTGFGGPPAHIALLRPLLTQKLKVMGAEEFQDANAASGLLPGPASTQMAIFCAYRAAGPAGAVIGGLAFISPAVVIILALSVLFLAGHSPLWVRGAGAGAGSAVAAVALRLDRPPVLRDNANLALFLASDDSAYMSGVCIPATDGGTLARVAMVFPEDLGQPRRNFAPLSS